AVTVGFLVHAWSMAPGLTSTARFLDRELRLHEQLATALELETASTRAATALGSRAQRVAADAGQAAANAWRAGPVVAGREWAALAALLLGLTTIVTHQSSPVAPQNLAASSGQGAVLVPTLLPAAPSGVSNSRSIAVRVAVVSAQDGSSSPLKAAPAQPVTARAAASHAAAHGAPPASAASTSSKIGGGKASGTTNGHAVPLKFNQSFLPTSPSGAAKKGGLLTGSKAPANGTKTGNGNAAKDGTAGSATAPSRTAKGGAAGPSSSGAAAQNGGKAGSAGAKTPAQCLYKCNQFDKSQIAAPGLIVGKGQFSGQSAPGGKTSGHGAGAAPRLGSAKTPAPAAGHQLSITSGYGPTHAERLPATQARGHNGPGGSGQAGVSAGAASSQTLDYVPPDANATNPGDAGVVIRYFTPSSAP
ncbi:MAG TPA: hypothetical protein VGP33_14215, partial [Chloroflexota bacterium]|nr:hypothetical protein [Chloroflexota bacterium]